MRFFLRLRLEYIFLSAAGFAALLRLASLPNMLPDERIYRDQAVGSTVDSEYSTHFFDLAFGLSKTCGMNAYSCGKMLNLTFWIVLIAAFSWISYKYFHVAVLPTVALIAGLPIWAYAAQFSPDNLYFALSILIALLTAQALSKDSRILFAVAGALSGLSALTKVHSLVLLFAVIVATVLTSEQGAFGKRFVEAVSRSGIILGAFLVVRFGLGFALAGPNGLNIFGDRYSNFLVNMISLPSALIPESQLASGLDIASASTSDGPNIFAISLNFLLVAFVLIPPLVLSRQKDKSESNNITPEWALHNVVLISVVVYLVAILGWSVLATQAGDSQEARVIARYFEFLIPLVGLATYLNLRDKEADTWQGSKKFGLGLLISGLALVALSFRINAEVVDFATLSAVQDSGAFGWLFLVGLIGSGFYLLVGPSNVPSMRIRAIGMSLTLLLSVAGIFSFINGNRFAPSSLDKIGQQAAIAVEAIPAEELTLVSPDERAAEVMRFYLAKPGIQRIITDGDLFFDLDPEKVRGTSKWLLLTGGMSFGGDYDYVRTYDGFQLFHLGDGSVHYFAERMTETFVGAVSGDYSQANYGIVVKSPSLSIELTDQVASGSKLGVQYFADENYQGQSIAYDLCGTHGELPLDRSQPVSYFELEMPECSALTLSKSSFETGNFGLIFLKRIVE